MKLIRIFSLLIALLITGCATTSAPISTHADSSMNSAGKSVARADSKLGTQWGEGLQDSVRKVDLKRISQSPIQTIEIAYSAVPLRGTTVKEVMIADGRIGVSILNERGQKMPLIQQGTKVHLQGKSGERYQLFYHSYNQSRAYEIVATVDGLDVINGTAGSFRNGGYVLYPEQTLTIAGFRKSSSEVAAFRFAKPNDAYAANTQAGSIRNVGVIGAAVFMLNYTKPMPKPINQSGPNAFPGEKGYAPAPRYNY